MTHPWEDPDEPPQYRIGPGRHQQQPILSMDLGPLMDADAERVRLAREALALERERLQVQEARTASERKKALIAATIYPSIGRLAMVSLVGAIISCIGIMLLSFLPQGIGWSLIFFGAIIAILAFISFFLLDDQKQRVKKNLE